MTKSFVPVDPKDPAFFPWKENFMLVSPECRCRNMEAAFNRDMELCKAYVGRELLEMMQNADDQKSSVLEFRLDSVNCKLTIVNSGPDTIPFDKTGFECLIRADTSGKRVMGNSAIGHKGYGFRSLLNWAEEIVIHSNGVLFSFGESARTKAWNEICKQTDFSFEAEKAKLLDRIGKAYGGGTIPLSIMSAPDARPEKEKDGHSWTERDGYVTSIAITFRKSKLEDIKSQLEAITPESLLFVRNLGEVRLKEIDADGTTEDVRTLSCTKTGAGANNVHGFETTEMTLRDGDEETPWKKVVRNVGENGIAVAWRTDRKPLDPARRVAYTYFPTTFRLPWLPCILHATFGLDPSRNGVNHSSENATLMRECGALLADVAADIAASTDWNDDSIDDNQVWFPYDMLDMGDVAETDNLLRALREGVQKKEVAVCPVTSRRYMPKDKIDCYGEELASYLVSRHVTDCFERHAWRSFETRKFSPCETPSLEKEADKLLRKLCPTADNPLQASGIDFTEYVAALAILIGIREKRSWPLRVSCLPDLQCHIVGKNTTGYVHCGEMLEGAADSLGIHYVHLDFKKQCQKVGLFKGAWENGRGLVTKLRDFCRCSSSDLNPMKDLLVLHSINGYPDARGGNYGKEDCFREVVKSLYALYSGKPESEPMSRHFHVLCEDGNVRESADACLWDEEGKVGIASLVPERPIGDKWKMKGSLQFWQSFLQSETAKDKGQLVAFFHGFLGVSLGFPCKVLYCSKCDGGLYLLEQCETAKSESLQQCKPHYFNVNAWIPPSPGADSFQSSSELESNSLYGLDEEFWGSLRLRSQIDFFELVTRDPSLCGRIAYSPVVFASYHLYSRLCTFKESYLAYSIRRKNWIADVTADAVEERIKDWDSEQKRRARELMRILGISRELEDLPVEEIYDRIARRNNPNGIGSFYSRARMAIRKRIEEGATTEEDCSQLARTKLEKLFARVKNTETGAKELKLVNRCEIQYWDNALVSKSLLDSLPKLEIGSRIGAPSVERLFGVHQFKSDDIRVLDTVGTSEETELSEAVNARLRELRAYLLAGRFRDEWRDDGNPKIDKEADKCKTFEVRIVRPVPEAFMVAGRNTKYGLSDGDLLQDQKVYWICSTAVTIDELWSRNAFRKSVVEALCIHFQLTTGTQIESAFREVLRNTAQENEELRSEMLPDDRWKELVAALGLSDEERAFWKVAAAKAGRQLSDRDFDSAAFDAGKWKATLASWFGIVELPRKINRLPDFPKMTPNDLIALARWCGMVPTEVPASVSRAIRESVAHQAKEWRIRAEASFTAKLHEKLVDEDAEKQKEYVPLLHQFRDFPANDIAVRFMEEPAFPEDVNRWIGEILCDETEKLFGIRPVTFAEESNLNPLSEYGDLLKGRKLADLLDDEQSLAYFPGNEDALREAFERQKARHAVPQVVETGGNSETVVEQVLRAEDLKRASASATTSPESGKTHSGGGGFDTDAEKLARGETAEQIVERMLERWKKTGYCLQYGARSSISGRTGMADDGAHFDFWYETAEREIRLMEVKSYAGFRVVMTKGEYEKATSQAWRDKYDLVLVMEGKPYILKGPLFGNDSEFRNLIQLEPATYNLRIELRRQTAVEATSALPASTEAHQP